MARSLFRQDGAVAVAVSLLLGMLLSVVAISVGAGAFQADKLVTHTAAEVVALEVARDCQETGNCVLGSSASLTYIKSHLKSLNLAEKYGVSTDTVEITALSVDSTDSTRSRVAVKLSRQWAIPMSELLISNTSPTITESAAASWTSTANYNSFAKGTYLPLMVNTCVFPELIVPSSTKYKYWDNQACSSLNNSPRMWWFGNAGASADSCFTNNQGPTLLKTNLVLNSSVNAQPTTAVCAEGDYWVPTFSKYVTPIAKYTITWTLTYTPGGKNPTPITVTETKDCLTDVIDYFASSGCTSVSLIQSPAKGTICTPNKNGCSVSDPVRVSVPIDGIPYGIVEKFMRVHLSSIDLISVVTDKNPAQPYHYYTLSYAGHDIRLLPN